MDQTKDAVAKAIEAGYRHFDTAQAYFNEDAVGEAIAESGIDRSEFFITTKVWHSHHGYEKTKEAFEESLKKLQTDYIDLLSEKAGFITGMDLLIDGGTIAAINSGKMDIKIQ